MLQNKSEWCSGHNNCCTISSLTSGGVLPRNILLISSIEFGGSVNF